jgi:hypothetical protein
MNAKKSYQELITETAAIRKNIAAGRVRREALNKERAAVMAYMNIYGQILDLALIHNKTQLMIEEATVSDSLYAENCVPLASLVLMRTTAEAALRVMKDKFPEEYERSFSSGKVF